MEHRTKWYLGLAAVLGTATLTGVFYNIDKASHPVVGRDAATLVSDEVGGVVRALQNKIIEYENYPVDYKHFLGYSFGFMGLSVAALLLLITSATRRNTAVPVAEHPDPWLR